uniref:CSON002397 protein n=1 Tax=Culicoides sonorensis TaxID=179676 RepID=A0A336JXN5_CULSO
MLTEEDGSLAGPSNGLDPIVKIQTNSIQNLYYTGNSFELAAGASLSDDSGFVPHTNSSVSSGGSSSRGVGEVCRFEFEMAESDGEVSQFDSLDNFSDGGMSAENYNTLKKGPLAPIEPPPEFQDSPQTTMMRSQSLNNYGFRLTKAIISNAMSDLREMSSIPGDSSLNGRSSIIYFDTTSSSNSTQTTIAKWDSGGCRKQVQKRCRQHIYGSDSFLDQYDTGNIYDEPNSEFYDNHLLYSNLREASEEASIINHNQIYDYDLYYYRKRNLTPVVSQKKRRNPSLLFSPLHHHHHHYYHTNSSNSTGNRPNSRNSLTSRLSSSHNSLHVPGSNKADDSIFITQAMSHDALVGRGEISDLYNVPIDSDIYALPVDSVSNKANQETNSYNNVSKRSSSKKFMNGDLRLKQKTRYTRNKRRRRQNNLHTSKSNASNLTAVTTSSSTTIAKDKRHSVPENRFEPMQMTLAEVKRYYHNLYSSSSESGHEIIGITNNMTGLGTCPNHKSLSKDNTSDIIKKNLKGEKCLRAEIKNCSEEPDTIKSPSYSNKSNNLNKQSSSYLTKTGNNNLSNVGAPSSTTIASKRNHVKDKTHLTNINNNMIGTPPTTESAKYGSKKSQFSITFNLRQKFCNIFRFKNKHNNKNNRDTIYGPQQNGKKQVNESHKVYSEDKRILLSSRALPPLPGSEHEHLVNEQNLESGTESGCERSGQESEREESNRTMDFAANIEKVKEVDYGWYWGPISSEGAEKILSNEPDGSFIVRDSSDDHYIFSLTFKLDGCVRHVRIEQDQGTFSFGSCAKFKSRTIMEFIENAVEHSRSGRYLFFLHRRPEHGPMRVQLTNPVSRFKHIQSLQHMCRFVILKSLKGRKDLIQTLPLPRRILDYLSYKNVFSEQVESDSSSQSQVYGENNEVNN